MTFEQILQLEIEFKGKYMCTNIENMHSILNSKSEILKLYSIEKFVEC